MHLEAELKEARYMLSKSGCSNTEPVHQYYDLTKNGIEKISQLEMKSNHMESQLSEILKTLENVQINSAATIPIKLFICNECDEEFENKTKLKEHLDYNHPEMLDSFDCILCDFVSHSKHRFNYHLSKHIKCDKCVYYANTQRDLRRHMDTMHSTIRQCCLVPMFS